MKSFSKRNARENSNRQDGFMVELVLGVTGALFMIMVFFLNDKKSEIEKNSNESFLQIIELEYKFDEFTLNSPENVVNSSRRGDSIYSIIGLTSSDSVELIWNTIEDCSGINVNYIGTELTDRKSCYNSNLILTKNAVIGSEGDVIKNVSEFDLKELGFGLYRRNHVINMSIFNNQAVLKLDESTIGIYEIIGNRLIRLEVIDFMDSPGYLGWSLKIFDDQIFVGDPDGNVILDELGNEFKNGLVYYLEKDENEDWIFSDTITSPSKIPNTEDEFGSSLSIYGNTLVISDVYGSMDKKGIVYIYEKEKTEWALKDSISPPREDSFLFGHYVSLYKNILTVSEVNGGFESNGIVYIYEKEKNLWSLKDSISARTESQFITVGWFGFNSHLYKDLFFLTDMLEYGYLTPVKDIINKDKYYIAVGEKQLEKWTVIDTIEINDPHRKLLGLLINDRAVMGIFKESEEEDIISIREVHKIKQIPNVE